MAKTKTAKNTVTAYRNGVKKEFTLEQWNSMKKNNSTYGWKLKSDLPEEILQKDSKIEASKLEQLSKENESLKEENAALKEENAALTAKLTSTNTEAVEDKKSETKTTGKN